MAAVSVERLYRVTIDEHQHLLGGDETLDLVKGLITALGIESLHADRTALHDESTDHTAIKGDITPPAQIASGPVVEEAAPVEGPEMDVKPPPVEEPVATAARIEEAAPRADPRSAPLPTQHETAEKRARWGQADTDRLRALAAGGMSGTQIAKLMDRPYGTVTYQASKHSITLGGAKGKSAEPPIITTAGLAATREAIASVRLDGETQSMPADEPQPAVAPEPVAAPGTPVEPLLGRPSDWTVPETKALLREMGVGGGGFKAAAEKTGHGMGSCALRWKHLKQAGIMTVERYLSSPEAQA